MQALTSEELDAVRIALSIILQHEEQLPLATEPIETAFEKIDRAIDETRHEKVPCNVYALAPLYIRSVSRMVRNACNDKSNYFERSKHARD